MSLGNQNPFAGMGMPFSGHSAFVTMTDAELSLELVQLIKFLPLTPNGQELLLVIGQRLSGAAYPTEEQRDKPAGHGTFIRGINLHEKDSVNTIWERVTNLVNEAVYEGQLEAHVEERNAVARFILTAINDRISQDRLAHAQVYIQLNKDLSNWRALVDIPSPDLTGTVIRHYMGNHGIYYAYPIEFLNHPERTVPFSLIPPSWSKDEKWTAITIDFTSEDVVHYYATPHSGANTGVYVTDLKGNLKVHHDPAHL